MLSLPLGAVFLSLLLGLFATMVAAAWRKDEKLTWYIGLLTLLLATLGLAWQIHSGVPLGEKTGMLSITPLQMYFSGCILVFGLLAHLNVRKELSELSLEVVPATLALLLTVYCIVAANHILVFVILLPLCYLIQGCASELVKKRRAPGAVLSAATRSFLMIVILSLGALLLHHSFGSLSLGEMKTVPVDRELYFWLGWMAFLGCGISFLPMTSRDGFGAEYEAAGSWSVWSVFKMLPPMMAAIFLFNWIILIQTPTVTALLPAGLGVEMLPRVGLYIFLVLGSWGMLQMVIAGRLVRLLHAWLLQPLLLVFLGNGVSTLETLSWSLLSLLTYALAVPLVARGAAMADWKLEAPLEEAVQVLPRTSLETRLKLFVALLFLTPTATVVGYESVVRAVTVLSSLPDAAPASPEGFVAFGVLALSVALSGSQIFFLAKLFGGNSRSAESGLWAPMSGVFSRAMDLLPLVIFILLGIYPVPLYKYLVVCLSQFTWLS